MQAAEFVVVVVPTTHGSAMGGGGATRSGFNNTRAGGNPHLRAQLVCNLCVGNLARGETAGVERRKRKPGRLRGDNRAADASHCTSRERAAILSNRVYRGSRGRGESIPDTNLTDQHARHASKWSRWAT